MEITLDIPDGMLAECMEFKCADETRESYLIGLLWYGVLRMREKNRDRGMTYTIELSREALKLMVERPAGELVTTTAPDGTKVKLVLLDDAKPTQLFRSF